MVPAPPAVLFAGLLASSEPLLAAARAAVEREWGALSLASDPRPWTESDYYEPQMGKGLFRQFVAFDRLAPVDRLSPIKRRAIEIEETFKAGATVPRPVNIDPGLLDPLNLTLASTKKGGHRVWIGDGIWAEITVIFRDGAYQPLPWTYPDFRRADTLAFLGAVRKWALPRLRSS